MEEILGNQNHVIQIWVLACFDLDCLSGFNLVGTAQFLESSQSLIDVSLPLSSPIHMISTEIRQNAVFSQTVTWIEHPLPSETSSLPNSVTAKPSVAEAWTAMH